MPEPLLGPDHLRTLRDVGDVYIRIARLAMALGVDFSPPGSTLSFLESTAHDNGSTLHESIPSCKRFELRGLLILRFELIAHCIGSHGPQMSLLIFHAANDRLRRKGFPPCDHGIDTTPFS